MPARKTTRTETAITAPIFMLPQTTLNSPVIFVDAIPASGIREGLVHLTLETIVDTQDARGHVVQERAVSGIFA